VSYPPEIFQISDCINCNQNTTHISISVFSKKLPHLPQAPLTHLFSAGPSLIRHVPSMPRMQYSAYILFLVLDGRQQWAKCKVPRIKEGAYSSLWEPISELCSVTAIWDHTVLPATRHKWTRPTLTPARQASTRFTYPRGMEGWVDLGSLTGNRTHDHLIARPTSKLRQAETICKFK